MASTTLSRTISASPTNPDKFTISFWMKRGNLSTGVIIGSYSSNNFRGKLQIKNTGEIEYYQRNDGNDTAQLTTNRLLRDTNAWYHIVVQFDTTLGTADDRIKYYVNGTQETSMQTRSNPAQNLDMRPNQASQTLHIGSDGNSGSYFDGVLSHFHLVDGYIIAPTVFGETDSTTGEWKIKTNPTISDYGDDGFFILKDGNSVTDQSGKGNNFTVANGTLTKTEDCPDNVFATLNPLFRSAGHDINRGNTQSTNNTSNWYWRPSTLGAASGKYYSEVRVSAVGASIVGITDLDDCVNSAPVDTHFGKPAVTPNGRGFAWYSDDGKIYYNNTSGSVISTYTTGDILRLAMDIDNGAFYIGKNSDTWLNSGDPTSGSSKTGAVSTWTGGGTWTFANAVANNSVLQFNYGNGIFGQSTAVSSAGTNASGIGIFEYNVPSGYTALSTKGLNL